MKSDKKNPIENVTKKQYDFIQELILSNGIISPALDKIGATYKTYYDWLKKYPDFKLAVQHVNDRQIDFVESKLQQGILSGQPGLITFYLSTKGKKRGYGSKHLEDDTENEEFTEEDQKLMDDFVIDQSKKLQPSTETEKDKIARLKIEANERNKTEYDDEL